MEGHISSGVGGREGGEWEVILGGDRRLGTLQCTVFILASAPASQPGLSLACSDGRSGLH